MSTDERLRSAIKKLSVHLQNREVATKEYFAGFEAVFELLDQPWEDTCKTRLEQIWRDGYEQCLLDMVEAIAQEWNVEIEE